MNWSKEWGKPVAPTWVEPVLEKITEEAEQASEWAKTVQTDSLKLKQGFINLQHEQPKLAIDQYETQTITTRYHNKTRQITVTVVGDLGLDFDEDGWNIYHIPTLACFDKAVPEFIDASGEPSYLHDKQPLLNWMAKVQSTCDSKTKIMWNELKRLTPATYENSGRLAKEIIQNWCLSVKVE